MAVHINPISVQHVGVRAFSTGNKVDTWKVTFQVYGDEVHTVISVPVEGPRTAAPAVREALNKLHEFFREAEHVAELEKNNPTFKRVF